MMKKGGGDNRTQAATPADTYSRIPAGTTKQQKNKNGQRRKTKKSEAKTQTKKSNNSKAK